MTVDLHNFFEFFDPTNPKHVAAVEQLEVDMQKKCVELLDEGANWVRIYRTKLQEDILNVPYYPQTDNYRDKDRTCNSSSCAMCLEYLKPGTLKGERGDDEYLRKVFAIGDSPDHSVQTRVLKSYGVESSFTQTMGFSDLDKQLENGKPVVLGILHRGPLTRPYGGHMIVAIGKTKDGDYVVNDPYGSLNDGYTGPVTNGKRVVYKRNVLEYRWLTQKVDKTGWGRTFS
jgi:hypothetical protein